MVTSDVLSLERGIAKDRGPPPKLSNCTDFVGPISKFVIIIPAWTPMYCQTDSKGLLLQAASQ